MKRHPARINKKGAFALSMSTIVIIVIGVVILSLGLTWVRDIFSKITDLSGQAFAMSEQEIVALFSDSDTLLKVIPDNAEIEKGKGKAVAVVVVNLETESMSFKVKAEPLKSGIDCLLTDTLSSQSDSYTLASGLTNKLKLRAMVSRDAPLGLSGCKVELVTNLPTTYSKKDSLTVTVIK